MNEWILIWAIVTVVIFLIALYELFKVTRPTTTIQVRFAFKLGGGAVVPIVATQKVKRLKTARFDFDYSNFDGNADLESVKVCENGEDCTDSYTIIIADQKVAITRRKTVN
ncbi:hypothetical protein [Limosilactobacillus allomucosae]|uniref:Uncharacterized protein n=1 Tax=Limosilactobacillus allomucosae TaxID=3142938 RepID=A0AAU7C5K6_9LACO